MLSPKEFVLHLCPTILDHVRASEHLCYACYLHTGDIRFAESHGRCDVSDMFLALTHSSYSATNC